MLSPEQAKFITERRAALYHPDQLEVRVFSGDVYTRIVVAPTRVLACDPDGNERVDSWPERGVTLDELGASDRVIEALLSP